MYHINKLFIITIFMLVSNGYGEEVSDKHRSLFLELVNASGNLQKERIIISNSINIYSKDEATQLLDKLKYPDNYRYKGIVKKIVGEMIFNKDEFFASYLKNEKDPLQIKNCLMISGNFIGVEMKPILLVS